MWSEEDFRMIKQALHFTLKHAEQARADPDLIRPVVEKFEQEFVQLNQEELGVCHNSLDLLIKSLKEEQRKSKLSQEVAKADQGMITARVELKTRIRRVLNNWGRTKKTKKP